MLKIPGIPKNHRLQPPGADPYRLSPPETFTGYADQDLQGKVFPFDEFIYRALLPTGVQIQGYPGIGYPVIHSQHRDALGGESLPRHHPGIHPRPIFPEPLEVRVVDIAAQSASRPASLRQGHQIEIPAVQYPGVHVHGVEKNGLGEGEPTDHVPDHQFLQADGVYADVRAWNFKLKLKTFAQGNDDRAALHDLTHVGIDVLEFDADVCREKRKLLAEPQPVGHTVASHAVEAAEILNISQEDHGDDQMNSGNHRENQDEVMGVDKKPADGSPGEIGEVQEDQVNQCRR
jgi:hypothetical protein